MKSLCLIFVIVITSASGTAQYCLTGSSCTCRSHGIPVTLCYGMPDGTSKERRKFRAMIEGFYPGFYSGTPQGLALRRSCILRCSGDRPSKTELWRVFADMKTFGNIAHGLYQVPDALVVDSQSRHFLQSVPTMLDLSRKYPNCASWFSAKWNYEQSFATSDFYQWAKDVPIFEDPIIRQLYLRRVEMKFNEYSGKSKFIPIDLTNRILALTVPTIASEFPSELLDLLAACSRSPYRHVTTGKVSQLLRYGLIAIDTASRLNGNLTNAMMTQFISFLNALRPPYGPNEVVMRTPAFSYYRSHPGALAFQTAMSTKLNALKVERNLPLIDWDEFVVTQVDVDLILSQLKYDSYHLIFIQVFCEFAKRANSAVQCEGKYHFDIDAKLMVKCIPDMLGLMRDEGTLIAFVGTLEKADLAGIAFEAFKNGFAGQYSYQYQGDEPPDHFLVSQEYIKAEREWIATAFAPN